MLKWPPHIAARLRLLKTRAALPAWLFAGLAAIDWIADVAGGVRFIWSSVREYPRVGWLASPVGLLLLAVVWLVWLLFRPAAALKDLERLEGLRVVLRGAAVALREAERHPPGSDKQISASWLFMKLMDLLDDAFVSLVRLDYEAFADRERRMYKAADVPFRPFSLAADYVDRLADRITLADVDPGFRLPSSFTEWCNGHPPNIRPINWLG